MPCQCEPGPDDYQRYREETDRATRASCDMRTILRRHKLEAELCPETREWIARHDKEDTRRIKEENERGQRESLKQRALDKLNLDERRALGL